MTYGPARRLPPEARRRVLRAALLRPWALLVLVIGLFFFAVTLRWWAAPLTIATYAALVALAFRDPIFRTLVLEGRDKARAAAQSRAQRVAGLSPEERARRLQRGETRSRVETALETYRGILLAIEESGEPAGNFLADAVPELQRTAGLLVDLAEARERAGHGSPKTLAAIDTTLSDAPEKLGAFRAEVVRASIEDAEGASDRAGKLKGEIAETNRRLQELKSGA